MLFLLTGEVQIGKTRWLEKLVADRVERDVPCAGVLAPGQWVALLREGPTTAFPHALVVVRDYLADDAEALLSDAWPDRIRIAPDEEGRAAVLSVALVRCKSTYGDER